MLESATLQQFVFTEKRKKKKIFIEKRKKKRERFSLKKERKKERKKKRKKKSPEVSMGKFLTWSLRNTASSQILTYRQPNRVTPGQYRIQNRMARNRTHAKRDGVLQKRWSSDEDVGHGIEWLKVRMPIRAVVLSHRLVFRLYVELF